MYFFEEHKAVCRILDKAFVDLHFLAQFLFTTSEIEIDYYHHRVIVRVATRVAERFKT